MGSLMSNTKEGERKMKTPRTLQGFKDHPIVEEVDIDPDGIWVYFIGYHRPSHGTHMVRKDTVKELVEEWKDFPPEPCTPETPCADWKWCRWNPNKE